MVAVETGKSQLLLRRKMLHQNHESYKYVVPQKIWADWITTRREKMSKLKNEHFEKKRPKNKKHITVFPLISASATY